MKAIRISLVLAFFFVLSLLTIFLGNSFASAESDSASAEIKFSEEMRFYYFSINFPRPEIGDPDIDISAGYYFTFSLSVQDDPGKLLVGLCKTTFQLGVDKKLPPTPVKMKQWSSSGSIRVFPTGKIEPFRYDWPLPGWYKFTNGEVFINFPTAEEKANFENSLAKRRKKYCLPAIPRSIP